MNKYKNNTTMQVKNNTSAPIKKEYKTYIDYEIFQGKIRLVEDGKQLQIIERDAAIEIAKSQGKNLVQIAYNKNDFPHAICKIIDYGKFKYEQQKREKEAKKAARAAVADVKEVCFTIRIDIGDKTNKINHIKEFLSDGKTKVKVTVKLSRREMHLSSMAKDLMREIMAALDGLAMLDGTPIFNGNIMSCVLRPAK